MVISDHACQRMTERNVSLSEVHRAVAFGRRIKGVFHLRLAPGEVVRVYTSGSGKTRVVETVVRKVYVPAFK